MNCTSHDLIGIPNNIGCISGQNLLKTFIHTNNVAQTQNFSTNNILRSEHVRRSAGPF